MNFKRLSMLAIALGIVSAHARVSVFDTTPGGSGATQSGVVSLKGSLGAISVPSFKAVPGGYIPTEAEQQETYEKLKQIASALGDAQTVGDAITDVRDIGRNSGVTKDKDALAIKFNDSLKRLWEACVTHVNTRRTAIIQSAPSFKDAYNAAYAMYELAHFTVNQANEDIALNKTVMGTTRSSTAQSAATSLLTFSTSFNMGGMSSSVFTGADAMTAGALDKKTNKKKEFFPVWYYYASQTLRTGADIAGFVGAFDDPDLGTKEIYTEWIQALGARGIKDLYDKVGRISANLVKGMNPTEKNRMFEGLKRLHNEAQEIGIVSAYGTSALARKAQMKLRDLAYLCGDVDTSGMDANFKNIL